MNNKSDKLLFRKISSKFILIQKVCEVGVYLPETSNIIDFIRQGKETILVEPEPTSIQAIKSYFKDYDNVTLLPFAIWNYNGMLTLSRAEASTFATDLHSSPALLNDNYEINDEKNIEVECRLFSDIDKGDIDLISIDTEGSEWYVLSSMISRPKIISIETHGKYYLNPYLAHQTKTIDKELFDAFDDINNKIY